METVRTILPFVQIILSILLVAAILLQQRGSSIGGAFGGDNFSATYHKRRGAELFLYRLSTVLAILFVASTFLSLIVQSTRKALIYFVVFVIRTLIVTKVRLMSSFLNAAYLRAFLALS